MATTVPNSHKDLFQKRAFGSFTTLMPDGSPQTTPANSACSSRSLPNASTCRDKEGAGPQAAGVRLHMS